MAITFELNGVSTTVEADAHTSLRTALRASAGDQAEARSQRRP